jgi:hypothetical protein
MTAIQWLYAVANATVLATLLQVLGVWFAKLLRKNSPQPRSTHAVRFVVFFAFFLYSVARTMSPALDRHVPPMAFLVGWVVIGGVVLQLTSGRRDAKAGSIIPPKADSSKVD